MDYREQSKLKTMEMLQEILPTLPRFVKGYIDSLNATKDFAFRTALAYTRDIALFIDYLKQVEGKNEITLEVLAKQTPMDITSYINKLNLFQSTSDIEANKDRTPGKKLKVHSLFLVTDCIACT